MLDFCAGVGGGAVGAAFGIDAPVQHINKPSAGQQNGAAGIGASGGDRQSVDGDQVARIVIDLEAADNAVTGGLGRHRACYIQITDRITLDARRNAEDDAHRKGAHQKGLAEFRELHAIPSSWFGVRRQVC